MSSTYCYWSVVDGDYSLMMQSVIASARKVGVFKEFHIWTDQPIKGAVNHELGKECRERGRRKRLEFGWTSRVRSEGILPRSLHS